jgi:hypothetical protein
LADAVDPTTHEYLSVFVGFDPVDAAVLEALKRVRNSGAAVTGVGHRFVDVDKVDNRAADEIEAEARFALRVLVQRGDVQLYAVNVNADPDNPDWAEVTCTYINLRARNPQYRTTEPVLFKVRNGST